MFGEYGKYPGYFTADNEYKTNSLIRFFNKNKIEYRFSSANDSSKRSTGMVERVIGTLKRKIGIWIGDNNNEKFDNNIQDIVHEYNMSRHSTIRTEPQYAMDNPDIY